MNISSLFLLPPCLNLGLLSALSIGLSFCYNQGGQGVSKGETGTRPVPQTRTDASQHPTFYPRPGSKLL